MHIPQFRTYLADASLLIDLCNVNRDIINLFAQCEGGICVIRNVLEEVLKLSEEEASQRGVRILDPDITIYHEAAGIQDGLSFADHICLIIARQQGLVLITNDKRLKNECKQQDIPVLWELEAVGLLVRKKLLTKSAAANFAEELQLTNPWIDGTIIKKFLDKYCRR